MDTRLELLSEKWNEILQTIRQDNGLSDVAFKTWLLPLKLFRIEDKVVKITAPFEQAVTYIENKYKAFLYVAVAETMGEEYDIRIITEEEAEKEKSLNPQPKKNPVPSSRQSDSQNTNLNPKYTFETFVIGSNNRFAHAASVAVAESPGKEYNPLFLYGGVGLGKTHLMHSVAHYILQRDASKKVLYVTSEVFTNELIDSIRNGNNTSMTKFREKYRNIDVLLIDDIQFIIGKESTQEEFFHTFNTLYESNKQIVLASDRPPKEIKTLEDRLRTRFEWGLLADIQTPDFETRIAIIRRKAQLLEIDIPDDVSEYIANRLKTNIRQLEGVVKKLKFYKQLQGTSPSIVMAQNAIRDILNDNQPVPVTVERIINEVGRTYGISPADIRSTKRNAQVSSARQISIYIVREITQMPMSTVGKEFGGRDHSTIVYAIQQVQKNMRNDQRYKETVEDIIKNIRDS